jgi:hypothetical protein
MPATTTSPRTTAEGAGVCPFRTDASDERRLPSYTGTARRRKYDPESGLALIPLQHWSARRETPEEEQRAG